MLKKLLFFMCAAAMLTLTGCFEMVEEVYLNRDGSGKYLISIDMSDLFSDPMMKGIMEQAAKEQAGQNEEMEIDSIVRFSELPNADHLTSDEKMILKPLVMHIIMSESKSKMAFNMEYPFKDIADVKKMNEALTKLEGQDGAGANPMMGGPAGLMQGNQAGFSLKKKMLSRLPVKVDKDAMEAEGMEFAKMFLESAKFKTIYHLPGKVKKTTIPNATVDGSTVTVENGVLDIMEGKAKQDGDIKFK
ncbi:MAG: hypothetical protein H6562_08940 [Lewinellaceae bacterium]|nr:hypothetical protein [Lewinella sp.]MCB9279025.1 hypothetical protein [Lewinellaceae bacterium]